MREIGLIILGVGVLAVPSFCVPLRGDEAWYLTMAGELAHGRVLYKDAWDVTNPGVFAWYALAGTLFGFTEDGVRTLDLLWQCGLAVAVSAAARRAYSLPRLPVLPGVVTAALYFLAGYSNTNHLARAEGLAVFPLFVAVWGACDGRWRWLVAAGAAGGVAVLLKFTFGGVLAAAWLALLIDAVRGRRPVLRPLLGAFVGLLLPVGAVVGYFAAHDALAAAADALFHTPRRMLAELHPAPLTRLVIAVQWFVGNFAGPAAVAVIGVGCRWRLGRDPALVGWLAALVASVPVVVSQRQSWWAYHWMLPAGLIGVLVGYTLPAVRATLAELPLPRRAGVVLALAAAVAALPLLAAGGFVGLHASRHRLGVNHRDRSAARMNFGTAYQNAAAEVAWLSEPGRKPGGVFVCGDPIIHLLSGRRPDNRVPGWALEVWPAEVRAEVATDVARRRPVYVFLARATDDYPQLVRQKYPELAAELAAHYRVVRETPAGVWYERIADS